MIPPSSSRQSSAFSRWLRTGRLPRAPGPDGLEVKSNPWHDPADGRFTFAGSGRHHGASGADTANGANGRASARPGHAPSIGDRNGSRIAAVPKTAASPAGAPAGDGRRPAARGPLGVQPRRMPGSRPGNQADPVAGFVGGVGRGLYGVAEGTVTGVRAALTTNPATTIGDAARGIAGMIDAAIAAEDIPARVQLSRAAAAVAGASARDIGRAAGSVAGNVVLAVAPGTALSRVSALRRLRLARPRPTFDPPQIGWVKETIKSDKAWKPYNDSADGARPGHAPTLMRTMPDGSKRPVKFDGIRGDYVIDRKWKVVNAPRARAQLLRQSEVLAQHRLIGTWEVPTPAQKIKALEMLKKMNVTNIKVRIVRP